MIKSLRIYIGVAFLLLTYLVSGQINKRINLPVYDEKKIHYGFQLGLNFSTFKINQSQTFLEQDTLTGVRAIGGPSFELGFIFNYRLGEFFDARALPKVSFYQRTIRYEFKGREDAPVDALFEASIIELPLLVKYKSQRRVNNRLYMVGGVKPGIEVGARRRQERNDQVGLRTFSLSLEYGLGLDIYYPLFKFSPELRFSLGLTDLFKEPEKRNVFSDPIGRITPYTITFAILFE